MAEDPNDLSWNNRVQNPFDMFSDFKVRVAMPHGQRLEDGIQHAAPFIKILEEFAGGPPSVVKRVMERNVSVEIGLHPETARVEPDVTLHLEHLTGSLNL